MAFSKQVLPSKEQVSRGSLCPIQAESEAVSEAPDGQETLALLVPVHLGERRCLCCPLQERDTRPKAPAPHGHLPCSWPDSGQLSWPSAGHPDLLGTICIRDADWGR